MWIHFFCQRQKIVLGNDPTTDFTPKDLTTLARTPFHTKPNYNQNSS